MFPGLPAPAAAPAQSHAIPNLPIHQKSHLAVGHAAATSSVPAPKFQNELFRVDWTVFRQAEPKWASAPINATAPFHFLERDPTVSPQFLSKLAQEEEGYTRSGSGTTLGSNYADDSLVLPSSRLKGGAQQPRVQQLTHRGKIQKSDSKGNSSPLVLEGRCSPPISPRRPLWSPPPYSPIPAENLSKFFPNWHVEMTQRVEKRSQTTKAQTTKAESSAAQKPPPGKTRARMGTRRAAPANSRLPKSAPFEGTDAEAHSIVLQKFTQCTDFERSFPQLKITINPLILARQRLVSLRAKADQRIREARRIQKQRRLEENLPPPE